MTGAKFVRLYYENADRLSKLLPNYKPKGEEIEEDHEQEGKIHLMSERSSTPVSESGRERREPNI